MEKPLLKNFLKKVPPEGDISLEIELESSKPLPVMSTVWWNSVEDGSLRNGREYVSKKPLPFDEAIFKRIDYLFKRLKDAKHDLLVSHRTSVHVHTNVSNYTPTQIWTIVAGYWLFENLLYEYCGKERKGNHFCLRLKDAEDLVETIYSEVSSGKLFSYIASDAIKYGGVNLNSIYKFGSLEYRGMRGCTESQPVYNWAATLHHMNTNIVKYWTTPEDLLDYYYKNGWESTAKLVFHNAPLKAFLLLVPKAEKLVEENAYRVIKFAYGVSWKNYNRKIEKLLTKPKKNKDAEVPTSSALTWASSMPIEFFD